MGNVRWYGICCFVGKLSTVMVPVTVKAPWYSRLTRIFYEGTIGPKQWHDITDSYCEVLRCFKNT